MVKRLKAELVQVMYVYSTDVRSPIFGCHENCIENASCKFFAIDWNLSICVIANPCSISFDLFIAIFDF